MTEKSTVRVHYTGKLDDGTEFDSSVNREPLEFQMGAGMIIPGFEKMVQGMAIGESKTETIPADEAYGPRRDELTVKVPKEQLPEDLNPQVGDMLQVKAPTGQAQQVTVVDVVEDGIVLDANHPLAGQDLTFTIEVVEIE